LEDRKKARDAGKLRLDESSSQVVKAEVDQSYPSAKKVSFRIRWASIAIVSAILTLSGWALSSPIGSSPDDDFHLPSIWCGQGFRDGLCEEDINPDLVKVPYTTFSNSACFQFDENKSGACVYDESLASFSRANLIDNLYPTVYYWSMSWFASDDVVASTITMRVVNSLLAVIGFTVLIVALPLQLRRIPLVGLLVSVIPLGVFLIASTNPSGWSYVGILLFFSSYLAFLSKEASREKLVLAIIAGVSLLLAAGSRVDAAVYAVIAMGVGLILQFSRKLFSPINVAFSLALLLTSVYSYLSVSTGSEVVGGSLALTSEVETTPSLFVNLASLPNLWIGVFGTSGLGWLDTNMPAIVWATTLSIYSTMIFASVKWFSWRQAIAVSAVFFALIAIPLYILTVSGLSVGQQVQPRYLLPLIALLGAAVVFRESTSSGLELTRGQAWIIGTGLFIANTIAIHLNARRYITGMDQQGVNLDKNIEWWWADFPLSPNLVTWSASIAFALFLMAIWKLREPLGLPGYSQEEKIIPSSLARKN
jgi:hypothetical protein